MTDARTIDLFIVTVMYLNIHEISLKTKISKSALHTTLSRSMLVSGDVGTNTSTEYKRDFQITSFGGNLLPQSVFCPRRLTVLHMDGQKR